MYDLIIVALTGLCVLVGTSAFYKGVKVGNISVVSAISNTWGVITMVLSIIFLHFQLTSVEVIGAIIIVVGTVLASFKLDDLRNLRLTKLVKGAEYAFLAAIVWGLQFLFVNVLVVQIGWFIPLLLVYATVTLYGIVYFRAKKVKFVNPKPAWVLLALNGLSIAIASFAYNVGVTSPSALIVAPIAAASPAVTISLAMIRLGERPDINQLLGILMIVGSLVFLSL